MAGKSVSTAEVVEPPVYHTYEDFPPEDLYQYAGVDCLATTGLLTAIFPRVVEQRTYQYSNGGVLTKGTAPAIIDFMGKVEMPAHEFIIDMELNGIQYDVDLNRSQSKMIAEELPGLEEKIFSLYGNRFNPDSGKELSKILYSDLGFTPPSYTQKKEPSTDGDALASLASEHDLEWLRVLARRNNLASVDRTFFRTYVEDFVKSDGRIHPSYNLFGTSSYRITGSDPNLTQLPNAQTESRLGYAIRECYTASPGHLFLCADQSSAEVKILGALCKDPKLLRAIAEGKDFHSYSATQMHGLNYEEFVIRLEYKGNDPEMLKIKKHFKALRQGAKALTLNA
jgi:DNA polymerase I-like protein with 3'-5' exonuclease and polymerase domains